MNKPYQGAVFKLEGYYSFSLLKLNLHIKSRLKIIKKKGLNKVTFKLEVKLLKFKGFLFEEIMIVQESLNYRKYY